MSNEELKATYSSCDLVLGADQGQGPFCAGIKTILRSPEKKKKRVETRLIGEIECRKDTLGIVEASLAPILNEYINKIVLPDTT